MIEKFYGRPENSTFPDIIDQYSVGEINSLRTSTLPLLNYWKDADRRLPGFLDGLGIRTEVRRICFEYPTRSYRSNKSSMTDVMLFSDNWRLAIEGKFTEVANKQETVSKWNSRRSENRSRVAAHWASMLRPFAEFGLSEDSISGIPYQFLHRTASACFQNKTNACVVYHVFYDDRTESKADEFRKMLADACAILKPRATLRVWVVLTGAELIDPNVDKQDALQRLKTTDLYRFASDRYVPLVSP